MAATSAPASAATAIASAQRQRARRVEALHDEEPHRSAHEHHPLDAEVEHARALGEQLAERRVEQRRAVDDRRRGDQDDEAVVHLAVAASAAPARPSRTR